VKKVLDLGVFGVTSTFSLVAYGWMLWVLWDGQVTMTEAIITFSMFFVLMATAYGADQLRAKQTKERQANKLGESGANGAKHKDENEFAPPIPYTALEVYSHLLPEETGKVWALEDDIAKSQKMRQFLQKQFGTSSVEHIDLQELKAVLEGEPLMKRTKYRKMVAVGRTKPIIKKGQKYRQEHNMASDFDKAVKHPDYGFTCLHMSVSESIVHAKVTITNKNKTVGRIGVRTVDDTATAGEDFTKLDEEIEFKHGEKETTI